MQRVDASTPAELTAALGAIQASWSQALLVQNDPMLTGTEQSQIVEFAAKHRLPTVFESLVNARQDAGLHRFLRWP